MTTIRRWVEGYQPLCSIDSVSGEIKSISPFKPLRNGWFGGKQTGQATGHWENNKQSATNVEVFYKVISSQNDYEECREFRATLAGGCTSDWAGSMVASNSALDKVKVNNKDLFAYFTLRFQSSSEMLDAQLLKQLRLSDDAMKAAKAGCFRQKYGDMVVVGYITGGEVEAALRMSKFEHGKRSQLRAWLEGGFRDQGDDHDPSIVDKLNPSKQIKTGYNSSEDTNTLLKDCSSTMFVRRSGITEKENKANPVEWKRMLRVLEKSAMNGGERIAAICYKMELFDSIPQDLLGFQNIMLEQNVQVLRTQFSKVSYVRNSTTYLLEAYSNKEQFLQANQVRRATQLRDDAMEAEKEFLKYTSSLHVEELDPKEPAATKGNELLEKWNTLNSELERSVNIMPTLLPDVWRGPAQQQVQGFPVPIPDSKAIPEIREEDPVMLVAKVLAVRNLPDMNPLNIGNNVSDYYVSMEVQGQKFKTSICKRASGRAEFNHNMPEVDLTPPWTETEVEFKVKLHRMYSWAQLVGSVTVDMSKVPRGLPPPVQNTPAAPQPNDKLWLLRDQQPKPPGMPSSLPDGMDPGTAIGYKENTGKWLQLRLPDDKKAARGEILVDLRLMPCRGN